MTEIEELEAQANAAGISMNAICKRAGVARSTPQRWKEPDAGLQMKKLKKLQTALAELASERREKMAAAGL